MTSTPYENSTLTSSIVSQVYVAAHLLQSPFIAVLKSIRAGWMGPIAATLIFAVMVLSTIRGLHSNLALLLDSWGIAVVLIACGILAGSVWVANIAKRRAAPTDLKARDSEPIGSNPDPADPEIEIMVRLIEGISGILGQRRCIVTVRYPMEEIQIAEQGIGKSTNGDGRRYTGPDHKLPFWVKR